VSFKLNKSRILSLNLFLALAISLLIDMAVFVEIGVVLVFFVDLVVFLSEVLKLGNLEAISFAFLPMTTPTPAFKRCFSGLLTPLKLEGEKLSS